MNQNPRKRPGVHLGGTGFGMGGVGDTGAFTPLPAGYRVMQFKNAAGSSFGLFYKAADGVYKRLIYKAAP